MKKPMVLAYFLIATVLFSDYITIRISPRGGGESIAWTIERDAGGIVVSATKSRVSDNAVIEKLEVVRLDEVFKSEYSSNQYHFRQTIRRTENRLDASYSIKNDSLKKETVGTRTLQQTERGFIDNFDGRTVLCFDVGKQELVDGSGKVLMKRDGDTIFDYGLNSKTKILRSGRSFRIIRASHPTHSPATKVLVIGKLSMDLKTLMMNYCLLPNNLRFLLFLS